MYYTLDSVIYNQNQLHKAVGGKLGFAVCRAQPPRQQDLDEWGAYVLQPDSPPVADVVISLNTAIEIDGLWYRDYDTRSFTEQELSNYQNQSINTVNGQLDSVVNSMADYYPPYERETWPQQESEARAYDADNSAMTPVIDAIMAERGLTDKSAFASNIIAKADAYRSLAATYVGKRQVYRDRINSATTKADIDAIVAEVLAL